MEEDINKLILNLQQALNRKYGEDFKRFYLTKQIDENNWEGLIHTSEEGERNVVYYTILKDEVVEDEKIFH